MTKAGELREFHIKYHQCNFCRHFQPILEELGSLKTIPSLSLDSHFQYYLFLKGLSQVSYKAVHLATWFLMVLGCRLLQYCEYGVRISLSEGLDLKCPGFWA